MPFAQDPAITVQVVPEAAQEGAEPRVILGEKHASLEDQGETRSHLSLLARIFHFIGPVRARLLRALRQRRRPARGQLHFRLDREPLRIRQPFRQRARRQRRQRLDEALPLPEGREAQPAALLRGEPRRRGGDGGLERLLDLVRVGDGDLRHLDVGEGGAGQVLLGAGAALVGRLEDAPQLGRPGAARAGLHLDARAAVARELGRDARLVDVVLRLRFRRAEELRGAAGLDHQHFRAAIVGGQLPRAVEFRRAVEEEPVLGHVQNGVVEDRQRRRLLVDPAQPLHPQQRQPRVDAEGFEHRVHQGRLVLAIAEAPGKDGLHRIGLEGIDAEFESDVASAGEHEVVNGADAPLLVALGNAAHRCLGGGADLVGDAELVLDEAPVEPRDPFPVGVGGDVHVGEEVARPRHRRLGRAPRFNPAA